MTQRRLRSLSVTVLLVSIAATVLAAAGEHDPGGDDAVHRKAVQDWVRAHRAKILDELVRLVSLPNVSKNTADLVVNATHLRSMLEQRGFEVRLLETATTPYIFARLAPAASASSGARAPVMLVYAHYDGQPVDPARWTVTPPFSPLLKGDRDDPDARLYGRSASDDKGPIVALLAAIDALRAGGIPPSVELKLLLDPEEEIGSPQVAAVLERHRDLLAADLLVFADGPVHQSGRPTVVFGNRGIVTVTLTVHGPSRALHSGHYGNWAPNPAQKLARLLASMKDAEGRVLVEGFYDDVLPLSDREREAIAAIPRVDESLRREFGIARPDGAGRTLEELINLPSLNVRGMASAWVGAQVRTIVPPSATAEIDMRLVKNVTPQAAVERLEAHLRKQGYTVVRDEPTAEQRLAHPDLVQVRSGHGTPATRTPIDTPLSHALITAVRRAVTEEPVLLPTLGGTVPMHRFETALGVPVYGLPIVNFDNNQHAPDENLRLGNLWRGIVLYASLLRMPPPAMPR